MSSQSSISSQSTTASAAVLSVQTAILQLGIVKEELSNHSQVEMDVLKLQDEKFSLQTSIWTLQKEKKSLEESITELQHQETLAKDDGSSQGSDDSTHLSAGIPEHVVVPKGKSNLEKTQKISPTKRNGSPKKWRRMIRTNRLRSIYFR
ncbi:expressed unknown protein [Seminavis robusta]|uniref:Uncharacterized protein n=1 Tax=Seminavis robusta TaxID=568900 RepID=A0A9N8DNC2_9STRA|nr:expressed unknown protein [Seminavis robusta]|eukprot:Sro243_g096880.1 n/a (149) ;mRNA; r:39911-40357